MKRKHTRAHTHTSRYLTIHLSVYEIGNLTQQENIGGDRPFDQITNYRHTRDTQQYLVSDLRDYNFIVPVNRIL